MVAGSLPINIHTRPTRHPLAVHSEVGAIFSTPKALRQRLPDALVPAMAQLIVMSAPSSLALRVWENWFHTIDTSPTTDFTLLRAGPKGDSLQGHPVEPQTGNRPPLNQTGAVRPSHSMHESIVQLEPPSKSSVEFDFSKAVKVDNAEIPTFLWDEQVWQLELHNVAQLKEFVDRYDAL